MSKPSHEEPIQTFITIVMVLVGIFILLDGQYNKSEKQAVDEPAHEEQDKYKINSMRYGEKDVESGIFTTKTNRVEYVEVVVENIESQEVEMEIIEKDDVKIGAKSKVRVYHRGRSIDIELEVTDDEYADLFHSHDDE